MEVTVRDALDARRLRVAKDGNSSVLRGMPPDWQGRDVLVLLLPDARTTPAAQTRKAQGQEPPQA